MDDGSALDSRPSTTSTSSSESATAASTLGKLLSSARTLIPALLRLSSEVTLRLALTSARWPTATTAASLLIPSSWTPRRLSLPSASISHVDA